MIRFESRLLFLIPLVIIAIFRLSSALNSLAQSQFSSHVWESPAMLVAYVVLVLVLLLILAVFVEMWWERKFNRKFVETIQTDSNFLEIGPFCTSNVKPILKSLLVAGFPFEGDPKHISVPFLMPRAILEFAPEGLKFIFVRGLWGSAGVCATSMWPWASVRTVRTTRVRTSAFDFPGFALTGSNGNTLSINISTMNLNPLSESQIEDLVNRIEKNFLDNLV